MQLHTPNPQHSGNFDFWWDWHTNPDKLTAAQWMWYLELLQTQDPRVPQLSKDQMICVLPKLSEMQPNQQILPNSDPHMTTRLKMNWTIATANVLTLNCQSTSSISRQMVLMQQFATQQCLFVGLQETRHKYLMGQNNEFFHILGHPANASGHDGIQLWVSKTLPLFDGGPLIHKQDIRIVSSAPNYLLIKIKKDQWQCAVLTCRAPHSARPHHEIVKFWTELRTILLRKVKSIPVFFCGDTNAHVGEFPTASVGNFAPDTENAAGQVFHEWLINCNLFLPATFEQFRVGANINTFTAADGNHEARIDFVALPLDFRFDAIQTWVSNDIDISVHIGMTIELFYARSPLCNCSQTVLPPSASTR